MEGFRGKLLINTVIMAGGALVAWYGPMLVFGPNFTGQQNLLFLAGVLLLVSALEHFGVLGGASPSAPPPKPEVISFACPHCAAGIDCPREGVGGKAPCPSCKKEFTIPTV